jgi:hypothetical protein
MKLAPWPTSLRSSSRPGFMRRTRRPAAPRCRLAYPPRMDCLEDRTLLNGDPFTTPLPVDIAPGLVAGTPGFVGPVRPAGLDDSTPAIDPDPIGLPTYQAEREPNDTLAGANRIAPVSRTTGTLAANDVDYFQFTVTAAGRLTARVQAYGVDTRLSLLRADGGLLVQSDGEAPGRLDDFIDQHLDRQSGDTAYFLKVEGLGAAAATYVLTAQFQPAGAPFRPVSLGSPPIALLSDDFDGDGRPDLAVAYGDSSFSDGVYSSSGGVRVLLGTGDGTFRETDRVAVGGRPVALLSADFDGDGRPDLAVAHADSSYSSSEGDPPAGGVTVLLGEGAGAFRVGSSLSVPGSPEALVSGDFGGDGRPDLAVAYGNSSEDDYSLSGGVWVLLGEGAGTFRVGSSLSVPGSPEALLSGDFGGDGRPDLAVAYGNSSDDGYSLSGGVVVLLRTDDETFQDAGGVALAGRPVALVSGDFGGDGRPDLAATYENYSSPGGSSFLGTVAVLLRTGDGVFQPAGRVAVEGRPVALLSGDFGGDSRSDLAVTSAASFSSGVVRVLLGTDDGRLQDGSTIHVVGSPRGLLSADFDGDGRRDLAVTSNASFSSGVVTVLLGTGAGMFRDGPSIPVMGNPAALLSADFNGDGRPDLAVAYGDSSFSGRESPSTRGVAVLLGSGAGMFRGGSSIPMGGLPNVLLSDDFNGDGRPDLAVAYGNYSSSGDQPSSSGGVLVLLGSGDGTFRVGDRALLGGSPTALLSGDFNGDGRPDFVVTYEIISPLGSDVSVSGVAMVFLGTGDGTFSGGTPISVAGRPVALLAGDFDRDGRADDLAVASGVPSLPGGGPQDLGVVTVLLGTGTGTFRDVGRVSVSGIPAALLARDFDRDGRLDLAVASGVSPPSDGGSQDLGVVTVLLGTDAGTFRAGFTTLVPGIPAALLSDDIDRDGRLDLAVASGVSPPSDGGPQDPGVVTVLLGTGTGTFRVGSTTLVPGRPVALLSGDFDGDRRPDLAVASGDFSLSPGGLSSFNGVTVLLNAGAGTFRFGSSLSVPGIPAALLSGNFDGDGLLDLAITSNITFSSGVATILLGTGKGTFRNGSTLSGRGGTDTLLSGDFNGDGRLDLAAVDFGPGGSPALLGVGDGTFVAADMIANPNRSTPKVDDFNGDGVPDVAITNLNGEILLRLGRPDVPGAFEPPVVLNPDPAFSARDLAAVATTGGLLLASLNARRPALTLYAQGLDGRFRPTLERDVPGDLPVRIASADLNRDGLGDIAVATAGGTVLVYLQDAPGHFGLLPDDRIDVGLGLSDLTILDDDGVHGPVIVVTNRISGDVSLLWKDGTHPFAVAARFRGGIGLYGVEDRGGTATVRSQEGTAGVVAGDFDGDGVTDLIVANSGAGSFSVLLGTRAGGFLNPQPGSTVLAGAHPSVVVAGRFDDDPRLDVAILDRESGKILIFLNDGTGRFRRASTVDAGRAPSGLSVRDADGDGRLDLMVGNEFGDVLTLPGNGDGSFRTYQRIDRNIALVVADLDGDRVDDFVFGNESLDRVSVLFGGTGARFVQGPQDGLFAPGAVATADLDGDGWPDLIVANSGSNNILVYRGLGGGAFDRGIPFFAGQNPVGVSIEHLNSDEFLDVAVANEGSNDVSILFGQGRGPEFFKLGPRVKVEGRGPVSTNLVPDSNADGIPDLLVTNSTSNNLNFFDGRADGLLNEGQRRALGVGDGPQQAIFGPFDGAPGLDLVTINSRSNDITFISNFTDPFSIGRRIATGGQTPIAALATDFNGDSTSDLIVAHNRDGVISLLLGGLGGLSLAGTATDPDLAHPAAIAMTTMGIVAVEEGEEEARLLTFDFGIAVLPPGAGPGPTEQPDFLPLPESSLAFVIVLLTDRLGDAATTRTSTASSTADVVPTGNAPLINYLSGLDQSFDRDAPGEAGPNPIAGVLAALDRALNRMLSAVTGKTGRTQDLVVGAVRDAVQVVVAAVIPWLTPLQGLLLRPPAGGVPASGAVGPRGGDEVDGEDHPALAGGPDVTERPIPGMFRDRAEPAPMSREDLGGALPAATSPSGGGGPDAAPSADAPSRIDAAGHLSAGAFFAFIAYRASRGERRPVGAAGRGRDPRRWLRRSLREDHPA